MMENRLPITVSELNEYVRVSLAGDPLLRCIRVTGEISGYKQHIRGHRYFSLKDEKARIQCVMFRQNAQSLLFQPRDEMCIRDSVCAVAMPFAGRFGPETLFATLKNIVLWITGLTMAAFVGALKVQSMLGLSLIHIFRILGKYLGAFLGCMAVGKPAKVRNYLGLARIPQAGVAIGLAALGARTLGRCV